MDVAKPTFDHESDSELESDASSPASDQSSDFEQESQSVVAVAKKAATRRQPKAVRRLPSNDPSTGNTDSLFGTFPLLLRACSNYLVRSLFSLYLLTFCLSLLTFFPLSPPVEAICTPGVSTEAVVKDWMDSYKMDAGTAVRDLLQFLIRSSGCPGEIAVDQLEGGGDEMPGLVEDMQEYLDQVSCQTAYAS